MFFPIEHSFDLDHLPDELTDSLFAGVIEQTPKQKVIQAPHNARHPVKTQKIDHPENKNVCPNRTPTTTITRLSHNTKNNLTQHQAIQDSGSKNKSTSKEEKLRANYRERDFNEKVESLRSKMPIEGFFQVKEQQRLMKIKHLEKRIYSRQPSPEITKKAKNLQPSMNLVTRLYELPLQKKRAKSSEHIYSSLKTPMKRELVGNENSNSKQEDNSTLDNTPHSFADEMKKSVELGYGYTRTLAGEIIFTVDKLLEEENEEEDNEEDTEDLKTMIVSNRKCSERLRKTGLNKADNTEGSMPQEKHEKGLNATPENGENCLKVESAQLRNSEGSPSRLKPSHSQYCSVPAPKTLNSTPATNLNSESDRSFSAYLTPSSKTSSSISDVKSSELESTKINLRSQSPAKKINNSIEKQSIISPEKSSKASSIKTKASHSQGSMSSVESSRAILERYKRILNSPDLSLPQKSPNKPKEKKEPEVINTQSQKSILSAMPKKKLTSWPIQNNPLNNLPQTYSSREQVRRKLPSKTLNQTLKQ